MSSTSPAAGMNHEHDEDAAHLASLGYNYDQSFKREMTFWGNVALGFTYLSPIVGVYSVFALSLGTAGPPMVWSLVIAFVGQLLVALVFGQVVSNYPVAGGLYPWSRRLWGRKWAWMNGWIYLLAMVGTIAGVVFGSAPFTLALFGLESTPITLVLLSLAVLAIATILNLSGTRVLNIAAQVGLVAELVGALVIGVLLLTVYREQDFSALFETFGAAEGQDYFLAFAAAGLIGLFAYYGFEANGNVAEEIKDPSRRVPKAMRMTLYIGGFAATFIAIALTLAMSDELIQSVIAAVSEGTIPDPIGTVFVESFGDAGSKVVLIVILISFISCATSLQAAVSRLTYSMARDGIFPGSKLFSIFSEKRAIPPYALLLAAVLAALLVFVSLIAVNALFAMIGFGTIGIYIAFQMVVLASLRASILGWKPAGKFTLGAWNYPVTVLALAWGILAIVNIGWPRVDWVVLIWTAAIIGIGLLYLAIAKPHLKGIDAPHGDATGAVKTVSQ